MNQRRTIALACGAVVTMAVFAVAMGLLCFGAILPDEDRIILVSIALGPVAMISVMIGYGVWWGVLFLLTLFQRQEDSKDIRPTL